MAISNELSSEIAAALLAAARSSLSELANLKQVVEQIHETLGQMDNENRRYERKTKAASASSAEHQNPDV